MQNKFLVNSSNTLPKPNFRLPTIRCDCGVSLEATTHEIIRPAADFESCLRRCEICGIGFSNANTANVSELTKILRSPFQDLPEEISEGHEDVLANAFNEINRASKKRRFAFSTSEDHTTWTVFRYLQMSGALRQTLFEAGLEIAEAASREPTMLLWGSPVPITDSNGQAIARELAAVADALGENKRRRSEPDLWLDFGAAGVVVIEVKLHSGNEVKDETYAGWRRYTSSPAFASDTAVRNSGLYELARNWRFGWEVAKSRPLMLVNLGPDALFAGDSCRRIHAFENSLSVSTERRFVTVTWRHLLQKAQLPTWLRDYLARREILSQPAAMQ